MNCFSGGRGKNIYKLQRFDSFLTGGKRWSLLNIALKAIPKLRSTERYSPVPLLLFHNGSEISVLVFLSSLTLLSRTFSKSWKGTPGRDNSAEVCEKGSNPR